MKHFLVKFLLVGLVITSGSASAAAKKDPPSVHGMLLFGQTKFYLSHLPMFHAPHDYQLLLEVELDEQSKNIYRNSLAQFSERVYTIVPPRAVLEDLARVGAQFSVDLYRGHFERGGDKISSGTIVTVTKLIFVAKLKEDTAIATSSQYLLFGSPGEYFLAHKIGGAPNFDQILEVKSLSAGYAAEKPSMIALEIENWNANSPLNGGRAFSAKTNANRINLETGRSLYIEHGDLEN